MGTSIRELMTDEPCSIDADKSVAFAGKKVVGTDKEEARRWEQAFAS